MLSRWGGASIWALKKVVPVSEPWKRSCQYLTFTLKVVPVYDVYPNKKGWNSGTHSKQTVLKISVNRNRVSVSVFQFGLTEMSRPSSLRQRHDGSVNSRFSSWPATSAFCPFFRLSIVLFYLRFCPFCLFFRPSNSSPCIFHEFLHLTFSFFLEWSVFSALSVPVD